MRTAVQRGAPGVPAPPGTEGVADAVTALQEGGVVVYPTETLYALGVRCGDDAALRRLVSLKGRERGKAIAVIVGDVGMLDALVERISPAARALMQRFWPGPLTIVFAAREALPEALTGGHGGIGVRLSSHPVARALSIAVGEPITAPSANPAGLAPPRRVDEAVAYFGAEVDVYVDGGPLPGEPASTVVDARVDARGGVRVLRAGAIPEAAVRAALEEVRSW